MNSTITITSQSVREAAHLYANTYKWLVFPLIEDKKVPAISGGFKAASLDISKFGGWWPEAQLNNIGIATGAETGVFAVDTDEKNGVSGSHSLGKLEAKYGALPPTLRCKTGTGGQHIYCHLRRTARSNPSRE